MEEVRDWLELPTSTIGYARTEVIILIHGLNATTITHTGEVIAEHHLDPTKSYQPKT